MAHPGEVPAHTAAAGAAMDSNVLAIVIAATVSTSVFIVAILILLLLLYHRDPMCCQFLCSCRFFQTPSQYDRPPPYFSSSQRLVGPQCGASRLESAAENPGVQGDELFCVGPPSTYQLPSWEQPRLPSYESVRKKDRQREIHQMIAERFGLWAEPSQEPLSLGRAQSVPGGSFGVHLRWLMIHLSQCVCRNACARRNGRVAAERAGPSDHLLGASPSWECYF
ncbi:uncharacterized protein LOC129214738 isoform X1 [Grus americana]|uniref:uncharacterized protein LOC129214738 isoform X1 n=1 Tax=Grus americana TaxID=9117 RepID=UPI002408325F|nr:uncharacterized protein LOC129214738 isoform X1 [Grus americana]